MTIKDTHFLLKEFPDYYQVDMSSKVVRNKYWEAERILLGNQEITPRGCSCNYGRAQQNINKLYEQWVNTSNNTP